MTDTPTPIPFLEDFDHLTPEMREYVIRLAINDLYGKTYRHERMLVTGNGEEPLPERVRNLEAFMASMKFWLTAVVLALLGQTIALIFALLNRQIIP